MSASEGASSEEVRSTELVQPLKVVQQENKKGFVTRFTDGVRGLFNIDYLGNTPLHTACKLGELATVEDLIKKKANPNTKNNEGLSPLLYACIPIVSGVNRPYKYQYKPDIVEYLLGNGALVDKDTFDTLATHTFGENARIDNELPVFDLGPNHNGRDATEILKMLLEKCSEKEKLLQYIKEKAKSTEVAPVIRHGQEYFDKERLTHLSDELEKIKESNGGKRKTRKANKKRKSVRKQKRRVRKTARR
jgi:hypothetical protein